MTNLKLLVLGVCLFIAFATGCSVTTPTGPSDEKLQLDFEDKIRSRLSSNLVGVDVFKIIKRESLSEDRFKYHITARLALDADRLERAQAAQNRDNQMFGPVSGFGTNRLTRQAESLDAQILNMTLYYKLNEHGIWLEDRSEIGHL